MKFKEACVDSWKRYKDVWKHLWEVGDIVRSFLIIGQRLRDIGQAIKTLTLALFWYLLAIVSFPFLPVAVAIRLLK